MGTEHVVVSLLEGTSPPPADGLLWNRIQFPFVLVFVVISYHLPRFQQQAISLSSLYVSRIYI